LSANGTIKDFFVPDSVGQWRVDAQFFNDTHFGLALRSKSFVVVPTGDGSGGGGVNGTNDNHAPVAFNDLVTTLEDVATSINVLANDSDPDGNSTVISFFGQAGNGIVTLNSNGTLTYSPRLNFNGHDSFPYRISDGRLQSTNATVILSVTPVNDPPQANAGPDQNVKEKSNVSLSGSLSSDPDGDNLTYNWTQKNGPAVDLDNANGIAPSFGAPSVSKNSSLVFELKVTDGSGASSTDSVKINVYDVGHDGGDDDCEGKDTHKHGETHKHKPKDPDKHKHGDVHKHKPKGGDECDYDDHDDHGEKDKDEHDHDDGHVEDNGNDKNNGHEGKKNNNSGDNDKEKDKEHEKSDKKVDDNKEKGNAKNDDDKHSERKDKDDSNKEKKDDKNSSQKKDKNNRD
jgi:hypothetical protein